MVEVRQRKKWIFIGVRQLSSNDFASNLFAEGAVAFPLDVVKDLIKGRLLWKISVFLAVVEDVFTELIAEAGLEQENPGIRCLLVNVANLRQRCMVRCFATSDFC